MTLSAEALELLGPELAARAIDLRVLHFNEVAWKYDDALMVASILSEKGNIILGCDVYEQKLSGEIVFANCGSAYEPKGLESDCLDSFEEFSYYLTKHFTGRSEIHAFSLVATGLDFVKEGKGDPFPDEMLGELNLQFVSEDVQSESVQVEVQLKTGLIDKHKECWTSKKDLMALGKIFMNYMVDYPKTVKTHINISETLDTTPTLLDISLSSDYPHTGRVAINFSNSSRDVANENSNEMNVLLTELGFLEQFGKSCMNLENIVVGKRIVLMDE